MKSFSAVRFLAITISLALSSQPQVAAEKDFAPATIPTSTADVIPYACNETNVLITNQLIEIRRLQSRNITVTNDLAGYFYAVVKGRKIVGCPNLNPFDTQSNDAPSARSLEKRSSSEQAQVVAELCAPTRQLEREVLEQIAVLKEYEISIPDYLAGWWSVTKDVDKFLNCGFDSVEIGTVDKSAGET